MKPPSEITTVEQAWASECWPDFGLYLEGLDVSYGSSLDETDKDDWFDVFLFFYAGYYTRWYEQENKSPKSSSGPNDSEVIRYNCAHCGFQWDAPYGIGTPVPKCPNC